ncbi:MAG: methylated-DNA--[protein]-cysteine S-methyltransferase [Chloroflexota bacterium]
MNAYLDTVDSPAGSLDFAVNEAGSLLWLRFVEGRFERSLAHELERMGFWVGEDAGRSGAARRQLEEYAEGTRQTFDIPLILSGSSWQVAVWQALTRIPYGRTRSYGQIAAMVGRPTAARAVGRANATNRLPLVVPCHRVVGSNGALVGFAGGVGLKERLLAHETLAFARAS